MIEQDWLTSYEPNEMLAHLLLGETWRSVTDRQLWLFVAAVEKLWCAGGDPVIADSICRLEQIADSQRPSTDVRQLRFSYSPNDHPITCAWQCVYVHNLATDRPVWAAVLRDIVGNPFCPVLVNTGSFALSSKVGLVFDTAWLTWHDGIIAHMAQEMYRQQDYTYFPILADALEEAGCACLPILQHARGLEPCPVSETIEQTTKHCPGCGQSGHWRHGVHFDHEKYCGNCGESWEPGQPATIRCRACKGTGWRKRQCPHVEGCWLIDLLTGRC